MHFAPSLPMLFAAAFLTSWPTLALAQEASATAATQPAAAPDVGVSTAAPIQLEVDVTSTRTPRVVDDAPASVSVVTREAIQSRHVPTFDEALRREPGVFLLKFRGPVDNHTMTIIRGLRGQERTLLLVDDVPLNTALGGGVPFAELPVDEVERVEIARGPFSALYGGNALAGVINVRTMVPKQQTVAARAGYGTYGTGNLHVQYGDRFLRDRVGVVFGADRWWTSGYVVSQVRRPASSMPASPDARPVSGFSRSTDPGGSPQIVIGDQGAQAFQRTNVTGKVSVDLPHDSSLTLLGLFGQWSLDNPTYNTYLRDASGAPVRSGAVSADGTALGVSESNFYPITRDQWAGLLAATYKIEVTPSLSLRATGAFNRQWNEETEFRSIRPEVYMPGNSWTLRQQDATALFGEVLGQLTLGAHKLTVGATVNQAEGENRIPLIADRRLKDEMGLLSVHGGSQTSGGVFAQTELALHSMLDVIAGARVDHWRNHDGYQQLLPEARTNYPARNQTSVNPKVSVVLKPFALTRFRLSGGTAFRPPTLNQLYGSTTHGTTHTIGNPDLDPERVVSWEAGIIQRIGSGTRLSGTFFHNTIDDLIFARTTSAPDAAIAVRVNENAARGRTFGVEAEVWQRVTSFLDVFANGTWVNAKITRSPMATVLEGKTIPNVPEYLYNAGADVHAGPVRALLTLEGAGDAFARDDNSDVVNGVPNGQDPFWSVDAKVAYTWKNVTASVAGRNLADRRYFMGFGWMPGRTLYAELATRY